MKRRRLLWVIGFVFVVMNVIAFLHAYKFTHFTASAFERTKDPKKLSVSSKMKILFSGIDNPRPRNKTGPAHAYETVRIQSTTMLECWKITTPDSKGTVVMFHGYAGMKASLLERADEFIKLGYSILLVDFMGSGGSEGDQTSIGFTEADQVRDCLAYVSSYESGNTILFGTSMGAAAILKAMNDYALRPEALILECPFGSLYKTVCARFRLMGVPAFPMAGLLCFWGGAQNGYWAFSHNPAQYAKSVNCPTLILFGERDNRVSNEETDLIFNNLGGEKTLKKYPQEGHDVFLDANRDQWQADVSMFMSSVI